MTYDKYDRWMRKLGDVVGKCAEVTASMEVEFPELDRVRGHYHCWVWGVREHWWLVDLDDHVVDPTAEQFPSKGSAAYVPWDEDAEEPSGQCLNCGEYVYDNASHCNETCRRAFMSTRIHVGSDGRLIWI